MTSRLTLYNGALRLCGDAKLASLTEEREPRYVLDDVWDDGALKHCLEQGLWNFAMRTVQADYSASVEPDFGFRRAFDKPTDWVRTAAVAADEYFRSPLTGLGYRDEAGFWFADLDTIYVRYVSDDNQYGLDMSLWPETFTRFVAAYLAQQIAPSISAAKSRIEIIEKAFEKARGDARSKDAQNEGAAFPPMGGWASARLGGRRSRELGRP